MSTYAPDFISKHVDLRSVVLQLSGSQEEKVKRTKKISAQNSDLGTLSYASISLLENSSCVSIYIYIIKDTICSICLHNSHE